MEKPKYIYMDKRESLLESVASDLFTFVTVGALIYLSKEQIVWTSITVFMMFIWLVTKFKGVDKVRVHRFKSNKELKEFANNLPEDE